MRFINVSYMLVFIFILLMIALEVSAQEESYMYYKESDKGDSAVVIDTGYVVINGVLLRPPFYMELKNDTIWINGVAADPALPYTGPIQSHPLYPRLSFQHKLDSSQKELMSEIEDKYKKYNEEYGEARAQEMILSEYQSHTLLSSLTFHEKELYSYFKLVFQDQDNVRHHIFVKTDTVKIRRRNVIHVPMEPASPDTLETWKKARKRSALHGNFRAFQHDLQRGDMLVLARGLISVKGSKGILETVDRIKIGELTQQEGIAQLREYGCMPDEAIMIIDNVDSW